MRDFWRRQNELGLPHHAAATAFWLVIAAFPAGLVVVNLLGLVIDQQQIAEYVSQVAAYAPGTLGDVVATQLRIVAAPTPGTGVADTLLVLVALWTLSTAVFTFMGGIRAVYGRSAAGGMWLRFLAFLIGMIAMLTLGIAAVAADAATALGLVLEAAAAILLAALLVSVFYRISAGRATTWRQALPGAAVAAVGLALVVFALDLYSEYAVNLRLIYGSAAGVIVSMLATWLSVYVILLGALINVRRSG